MSGKVQIFARCVRLRALWSLLIVVPIGFYSKFYSGPCSAWVNNSLGGVFYEIFWCLAILLFAPSARPWKVASVVLVLTCCLEVLQLWRPPVLELLRSSFLGATVLGTTFTWSDFVYYFVGSALGWFWIGRLTGAPAAK